MFFGVFFDIIPSWEDLSQKGWTRSCAERSLSSEEIRLRYLS